METVIVKKLADLESHIAAKEIKGSVGDINTKLIFKFEIDLNSTFSFGGSPANYRFLNCVFEENVTVGRTEKNLTIESCEFKKSFVCKNSLFKMKVRFLSCIFHGKTDFRNTKFNDLADFWRSTFKQETIFYKTDFLGMVVFSATTFEKNVLFTYTLIEKLILFRGTVIKKGIDLSTAIISGIIGTFGLSLWDFKTKNGKLSDAEFETTVSEKGEIPIKNKRETFRILKQANIQQNNAIESIPYQVLEKKTLLHEHWYSLRRPKTKGETTWELFTEKWQSTWDLFVLGLNWSSNYFGKAPMQGVIFTLCFGVLFFYLSITQTAKYAMALNLDADIFLEEISNYLKFLLPTHSIDYLGPEYFKDGKVSSVFLIWDILGRIFVGFGIYQTIQAFRKFR